MSAMGEWNVEGKAVLLTGGTGSLAQALIPALLERGVRSIRLFARNEHSHENVQRKFNDTRLRSFIGDVRDYDRVRMAMVGVNIVIHAAALKVVPLCSYNPTETTKTNILGTENVGLAALDEGVDRAVMVSTDKAVEPVTLYGASKCYAEQLWLHLNNLKGWRDSLFCAVRYGNVVGSRGSVLPLFVSQSKQGVLTLTDERMSRFWLPMEWARDAVIFAIEQTRGGEVFIRKAPGMKVVDLAKAVAPEARISTIGLRSQEKLAECLITREEARRTRDAVSYYVVEPENPQWAREPFGQWPLVDENFSYTSNATKWRVGVDELRKDVQAYG